MDMHIAPPRGGCAPKQFHIDVAKALYPEGFDLVALRRLFDKPPQDPDWCRIAPSGRHIVGNFRGMPQGSTILHMMAFRAPHQCMSEADVDEYDKLCLRAVERCERVLNTRNASNKTALMMACNHKNFILAKHLLFWKAGTK